MGGPVKPEGETGGVGCMSRVASRIHQLEERGLTQFKRMIKNLLAGSVLCVADAAHVQLFPLLHEAALQTAPPSHPGPLHSAPDHMQQEEASTCEDEREEDGASIIHLSNKVNGRFIFLSLTAEITMR